MPQRRLIERLEANGLSRRDFMRTATMAGAALGFAPTFAAEAAQAKRRPSVIWLHFQECTGCTETLLRPEHPEITEVILETISLDYHETLFAAAGHQIEAALKTAMKENAGKYICVVEGAIPAKDNGIYCKIAGKTALQLLDEVAGNSAAVIALGSCASFGGVAAADPNPTGATGVPQLFSKKPVVSLPGCPANPYNLLGVVLQFVTYGTLPKLDGLGRPLFAYARTIHEDCPRRAHFDAGRFANAFGDEGHKQGFCLFKLGCKGPITHANCSIKPFCDVDGAWPIGIGAPCSGCTEKGVVFTRPIFEMVEPEPSARPILAGEEVPAQGKPSGVVHPAIAGGVGAAAGLLTALGIVAARKGVKNGREAPPPERPLQ
jgi:hydrogenase small subunit